MGCQEGEPEEAALLLPRCRIFPWHRSLGTESLGQVREQEATVKPWRGF